MSFGRCGALVRYQSLICSDAGGRRWVRSHVKESADPVFFWQECVVTVWCVRIFLQMTVRSCTGRRTAFDRNTAFALLNNLININYHINILAIDTLKRYYNFTYGCTHGWMCEYGRVDPRAYVWKLISPNTLPVSHCMYSAAWYRFYCLVPDVCSLCYRCRSL